MPYAPRTGRHSMRAYGESEQDFQERRKRRALYHRKLGERRRRNRDGKRLWKWQLP